MLIVETIAKIRRAFFVQGKSINAICRELRVSRKVVRKVKQRCWVHKTANVLNRLPKSLQGKAKRALQNIWMAETSPQGKNVHRFRLLNFRLCTHTLHLTWA